MPKPAPVCLIAETVEKHDSSSVANRTLEFTEIGYLKDVVSAIECLGRQVIHLDDPGLLIERVDELRDATIVSLWSGESSRSRRAVVGSICEGAGLCYAGADAYTAIVCQDKQLSKNYASRFGIKAPQAIVVDSGDPLPSAPPFQPPFVVKPVYEGGSIGIDERSLCQTWEDAEQQVLRLQRDLGGPLMIEEFLEGDELSICLMGLDGESAHLGAVQLSIPGFDIPKGIWSLELKKNRKLVPSNIDITNDIDEGLKSACRQLFSSFEKVDYMRIDGRMTPDGFKLIELTPDVHMGPAAAFASAMKAAGLPYEAMWETMLDNVERARSS